MVRGSLELEWVCHGCEALGQQGPQQAHTVLLPMEVEVPGPALDQQGPWPQALAVPHPTGVENFDISGREIEIPSPIVKT